MVSLVFLVSLALAAFFTPLLPLQSPRFQTLEKQHQFQPPRLLPSRLGLDPADLATYDKKTSELKSQIVRAADTQQVSLEADLAEAGKRVADVGRIVDRQAPATLRVDVREGAVG